MNLVTLSWIVHTRYLLQEPQQLITNLPEVTMPDQVQDTIMKIETGKVGPDCNFIFEDMPAWVVAIHTEATQGHNNGINAATTGATHDDHTPHIEVTAIDLAMTHHIGHITDHPHKEVLQLTNPQITAESIHDHPIDLQGRTHTDQVHMPACHKENHTSGRTWGWKLKIHTDYSSSSDHSNDSGEEYDHLK